jgi:hypothetical protein
MVEQITPVPNAVPVVEGVVYTQAVSSGIESAGAIWF